MSQVYIKGYYRLGGRAMTGQGMWDWADPNKNGVANAFNPNSNGVANFVTKTLPSALIHNGLPDAAEFVGSKFGVGNEARQLGEMGATELGKVSGMGFKKGSKEAKAYMAKLRSMRRK